MWPSADCGPTRYTCTSENLCRGTGWHPQLLFPMAGSWHTHTAGTQHQALTSVEQLVQTNQLVSMHLVACMYTWVGQAVHTVEDQEADGSWYLRPHHPQ